MTHTRVEKLGVLTFARFFYWGTMRRPAVAMHMLAVLPRFVASAIQIFVVTCFRARGRSVLAIALMDAMGDIVAGEPIARLARKQYPDAWICWISRPPFLPLLRASPHIDHSFGVGCLTVWMLLRRLKLFDMVWDLHHDARICLQCSIPMYKPGVQQNPKTYYNLGNLLDMECDSAGLPRLTDGPVIIPPKAAVDRVDCLGLPPDIIAIHCRSSDSVRDWPAENWRLLADAIQLRHGLPLVEIGLKPLVVSCNTKDRFNLCGQLDVLATAEVIRRARLFIGIDSGPAHLANAVGTRGVILLGSYAGFRTYMPYSGGFADGRTGTIVRHDGPVSEMPFDLALEAVTATLQGTASREATLIFHPVQHEGVVSSVALPNGPSVR